MNLSETARLLGAMAAFDRRTVGDTDVMAWQAVLADVAYEDALAAVKRWYSNNTEWIMPAHVRHLVAELVRKREVSPWAPGQYGTPRETPHPELPSGPLRVEDLPAAVRELLDRIPPGDPLALHPRRFAWSRQHRDFVRQQEAARNPLYDPEAARRLADGVYSDQTDEGGEYAQPRDTGGGTGGLPG